ncbi:MAG: gliding motility-associated C-terminal domain-containing protein [Chitinophagaceae bacterium]|nr:gliding motility-associated C-terminal domain-containing protein [Chitinophagaceae bacterium]
MNCIKRVSVLTFFLIGFLALDGQSQNWVWAQRMGNTKSDKITCIKTDSLGYVYIAGYFSNNITLGTNNLPLNYTANASSKEAFVARLDSAGFCYWARSGGEYFDDRVLGMDVDAQGNTVITGTFWQTGTGFNMGTVNVTGGAFGGGDQCFVVKHDASGNPLWGNFVCSNSGDDQGLDICTDKAGNHYVCGFMSGTTLYCGGNTVTATNTNTGSHKHALWLAKMNSAGTFQWARTFGNLPWDPDANKYIERDIAVCVDDSGGVYVTGGFDGTHNFGTQSFTTYGGHDIFVIKYDTLGQFKWATQGGSDKDDWSNGICSDKRGNIYITGEHRDSLIMDTVLVKNYNKRDAFVFKIDKNTGKPIWGKRAGSNLGGERGNDIVADTLCDIYLTGDINDGGKFGDNITVPSGAMEQAFVAKISPEGKWRWVATGGGLDSNDRGNAIAIGHGAQIYVAGYFRSPATYGSTNLTSSGSSDGFFARLIDSTHGQGSGFDLDAPSDSVLCAGDTAWLSLPDHVYLEVNPQQGVQLSADGKYLIFTHTNDTITYTISGFNAGVCPDYDTLQVTIASAPNPKAQFIINPASVPIVNPILNLQNQSQGGVDYEWTYAGNMFSTAVNTSMTFDTSGTYCFTLEVTNDAGCWDTVTHCGTIYELERVFLPNAFSPNGDGKNDYFGPFFTNVDLALIKDYKFMVYDRWGNRVFESDRPEFRWNGMLQNQKPADMGVYFFVCQFTTPRGEKIDQRADVTLIR